MLLTTPLRGGRARLVVLGCETGGRWIDEALSSVPLLASHRAESSPELLKTSIKQACMARWWGLLSVAAQSTLAGTLSGDAACGYTFSADAPLPLGALLDGADFEAPAAGDSRLPSCGSACA